MISKEKLFELMAHTINSIDEDTTDKEIQYLLKAYNDLFYEYSGKYNAFESINGSTTKVYGYELLVDIKPQRDFFKELLEQKQDEYIDVLNSKLFKEAQVKSQLMKDLIHIIEKLKP